MMRTNYASVFIPWLETPEAQQMDERVLAALASIQFEAMPSTDTYTEIGQILQGTARSTE